jgi:methionyl-tRNA synthetase
MNKKFYITTAIDYVNGKPHIGHALEKIQADVLARHHRILGEEVLFLTGTDENSLKNVQAAEKEKITTKKLVDRNYREFYKLREILNLSFDEFIRTTEKRHIKGVQKLWEACKQDIYKKNYKGLYCVGCEEFYKESELENGICPEHQTKPEIVEEINYFFRLSRYQEQLKKIIMKDELKIIPETRKNEILSFINSGLEDICISRSKERAHGWGIPVPGDDSQIIWVWFDALSNYITALDYADDSKQLGDWWVNNENVLHVIGKGILRFHAIYWPAMLLSADIPLPKQIFVHGYITVDNKKMSKSLGNVIDPFELVQKYGTDAVRYFLLREITSLEDGDFTYAKFEHRYNSDLANGLGNLVSRVISLTSKLEIPQKVIPDNVGIAFGGSSGEKKRYKKAIAGFKFNEALIAVWEIIGTFDRYIEREKPWEGGKRSKQVILNSLYGLKEIAELLKPFLPETSERILKQLETRKSEPLFSRL